MKINISKINFKGSGNNGGGSVTECLSLLNYTNTENTNALSFFNDNIRYTNTLSAEWDATTTSAENYYSGNTQMVYAPAINTSNVTNMNGMFRNCNKLEYVPNYDTSKVTHMGYMFYQGSGIKDIENIGNWDTSNVTNMINMFYNCSDENLSSFILNKWDVSRVTNMSYMFSYMRLTSLDMSGWEMSKVTDMRSMFTSSTGITNLNMLGATLPDINLSNWGLGGLYNLSIDSLVSVLNALPTTTKGYTVNIGSTNLGKLTDEQKSIATNKGWTIN